MDAVKCNKSGLIHLAESGSDSTICGNCRDIRDKILDGKWSEISMNRDSQVIKRVTCGKCISWVEQNFEEFLSRSKLRAK